MDCTRSAAGVDRPRDVHRSTKRSEPAPRDRDDPLPCGTVLAGRYVISRCAGDGATSRVYRARDALAERFRRRNTDVALKIFKTAAERPSAIELAHNEAWMATQFPHPSAARVHGFFEHQDRAVVTMEWIDGETLETRLRRMPGQRLPLDEALVIASCVAGPLAIAHEAGVVHCDVKPGNILMTDTGAVKLIDFSTARYAQPASGVTGSPPPAPEAYVGFSPSYASPQARSCAPATVSDDVYSLACVLYRMVAGHLPNGESVTGDRTTSDRAAHWPRPRALSRRRWSALRRALATRPAQRPGDVREFVGSVAGGRMPWLFCGAYGPGAKARGRWTERGSPR